jgi:hypothetical protein
MLELKTQTPPASAKPEKKGEKKKRQRAKKKQTLRFLRFCPTARLN